MEPRKHAICDALRRFIAQRPGLEFGNYGDMKAYRAEMRSITKDRHHAETLLRAVELAHGITADDLVRAAEGAYSGRLTVGVEPDNDDGAVAEPRGYTASIHYVTGQYFPTEYRRAVCAVLASALWDYAREKCMPAPCNEEAATHAPLYADHASRTVLSTGDWLRAHFRREFGRHIAARWFS